MLIHNFSRSIIFLFVGAIVTPIWTHCMFTHLCENLASLYNWFTAYLLRIVV